jgi:plasmid stabilization system protein ParE
MALTYKLHSLAKNELIEAIDWYEQERKGRGAKFFIAYLNTVKILIANPLSFPIDFDAVRKIHFIKFPYTIYYEIHGNEVFIYSIFHQRRNPEAWKDRQG